MIKCGKKILVSPGVIGRREALIGGEIGGAQISYSHSTSQTCQDIEGLVGFLQDQRHGWYDGR